MGSLNGIKICFAFCLDIKVAHKETQWSNIGNARGKNIKRKHRIKPPSRKIWEMNLNIHTYLLKETKIVRSKARDFANKSLIQ